MSLLESFKVSEKSKLKLDALVISPKTKICRSAAYVYLFHHVIIISLQKNCILNQNEIAKSKVVSLRRAHVQVW